ncbi:MarR family transcriptional regulator [Sphingorhabdus soli]|uniref:MarR family transcriptional regulator n=1 Tax=Flavisphingopyxis soli TaxID=2601267 RepID=A0A5C6U9C7_9SPHN|nr:MarR family transcriptional regulator [Sphingorhabdus soli]TXC69040.1 MarR family transcriptional regulator [Sphingorhabdus soli]
MTESIGFLMNDAARLFRKALDARAIETGVTSLQWRLLAWILRNPGASQGFLADRLEVEPITVSRMVDRLVEAGHIERRPDPDDRRAWKIYLTECAMPIVRDLRTMADDLVDQALDGLSPAERAEFERLVTRVRENLSSCGQEPLNGHA